MTSIDKTAALVLCVLLGLHAGAGAQDLGNGSQQAPDAPHEGASGVGATDGESAPDLVHGQDASVQASLAVAADPAVWGPYARLVGRTFAGETVIGGASYASATRTIQWEVPGEVMLETGTQADGTEIPQMRILPAGAGKLKFSVKMAPDATGLVADAGTLKFDLPFGWENMVRLLDDDSYEMKTLKRGDVQAHAVYRDVASAAHGHRVAEQASEKVEAVESARAALRAAGIADIPLADVPAERVLGYQEPVRGPAATLRISRNKAWDGSACYAAVYINGRLAVRLDESEAAQFNVPAGDVRVGVSRDPQGRGACGLGQVGEQVHETVVAKGEAVHVQISLGGQRFSEALLAPAP